MKIRLIIISLLLLFLSVITPIFAIPTGCSTDKNAYKYQCRSGGQIVGSCQTSVLCDQFNQTTFSGSNWKLYDPTQINNDAQFNDPNSARSTALINSHTEVSFNAISNGILGKYYVDSGGNVQYADRGAVGYLGNQIAYMTTQPPATTTEYLADLGRNAGVISQAYAQEGMGWDGLSPILKVWKVFRNISYMAFVIIFVVLGFMVMFRNKLNGQTVVTIQMALPQIIITLLLITFSYAIASLMIDLIYVSIYLVIGIFTSAGIIDSVKAEESILGQGMINIVADLLGVGGLKGLVGETSSSFANIVNTSLGDLAGFIANVFARFVIAIAILFACVKLFWVILKSYISLILNIIFSPIILLPNAIPGNKSFSKWLMSLLSGVVVFPITAVVFIIASALSNASTMGVNAGAVVTGETQALKVPFLIGGGGIASGSILGLVGFGILMVAPNLIEMAQKAIGGESALNTLGQPIMQNLGQGLSGATVLPRKLYSDYTKQIGEERQFKTQQRLFDPEGKNKLDLYQAEGRAGQWGGRLGAVLQRFLGLRK